MNFQQTPRHLSNGQQSQTMAQKKPQPFTRGNERQMTRTPTKLHENSAIQKELQFQDTQVRKKVHELNTFIQSVKVALEDKNLDTLDQLLIAVDNPKEVEKEEVSKVFKVLDGKDKNTISYQGKTVLATKVVEKVNEDKNPKTTEDLGKLLFSMHTLLEKNLQESSELKHQLKNSNIVNGQHHQISNQPNKLRDSDILTQRETNKMDQFQEDIQASETQLNQLQIQRLLTKIQELTQKILDLESQITQVFQNEENLKKMMLSSFCVSEVEYMETNFDQLIALLNQDAQTLYSLPFQKILMKIQKGNLILSYLDIDKNQTFKTITSSQIKDIFYPDKESHLIAIVYQPEDKEPEYSKEEQTFRLNPLHDTMTQQPQQQDQRRNFIHQNTFQVLLFEYEDLDEFEKWDLALWAICRKSLSLNQNFLFDNEMFERPFQDEFSEFNQRDQDLDRLRNLVEGVVQQLDPKEIIQRNHDMDMYGSKIQNQQSNHSLTRKTAPKVIISIQPDPLQQSQQKQSEPQKLKLTPRLMILQNSADEQSKIYRAIGLLKSGFCVIKYSSNQLRPNQRVIYLLDNEITLKWKEPLKAFERSKSANKGKSDNVSEKRSIQLTKVKSIKDYAEGPGFAKFRKQREGKENLAITIQGERNLELDASSMEEKSLIIECLRLALTNPVLKKILLTKP